MFAFSPQGVHMPFRIPGSKQPWFPFAIGGAVFGALARGPSVPPHSDNAAKAGGERVARETHALPSAGQYDMGRRLILDYLQGLEPTAQASRESRAYTVDVVVATLPDP